MVFDFMSYFVLSNLFLLVWNIMSLYSLDVLLFDLKKVKNGSFVH